MGSPQRPDDAGFIGCVSGCERGHPMFDECISFVTDRCGEITYGGFAKAGSASVKAVSDIRCARLGSGVSAVVDQPRRAAWGGVSRVRGRNKES